MNSGKRLLWVYGAILLLSLGLRVYHLNERPLWFDEATEFWTAYVPFSKVSSAVKEALQDPPLYSYLLHFWMKVSLSEFWLRLLSVIASLVGIIGIMKIGIEYIGYTWGWLPSFFVALAESDIRFAQEVGQYAMAIALIVWSIYFLSLYMKSYSIKSLIGFVVLSTLAIYTYYGAAISLGIAGGVALLYTLRKKHWKPGFHMIIAGMAIGILILPLLLYWLPIQLYRGPTAQAFSLKGDSPFWDALEAFPDSISEWILYQFMAYVYKGWRWEVVGSWIIWLPVLLLIGWGVYATRRAWIYGYLIVGILASYLLSRWGLYPFGGRHSLVFAPAFWISIGWATALLLQSKPWHKAMGLFTLLWASFISVKVPPEGPEDLRSIMKRWLWLRNPSDTTYVYYGAVHGLGYQLLLMKQFPSDLQPGWYLRCWNGDSICWQSNLRVVYGRWIRNLSPEEASASILQSVGHASRFWFLASHMYPNEVNYLLQQITQKGYEIKLSHQRPNAFLCLFERRT